MTFTRVCCFLLSVVCITSSAICDPIVPSTSSVSVTLGQTISIDASVNNIQDLYAYQFDWFFDPSLLVVDSVAEGTFLAGGGTTFFLNGVFGSGSVTGTADTLLGAVAGVNGSGVLATATFTAVGNGTSSLSLGNEVLLDSNLNPIQPSSAPPVPEPSSIVLTLIGLIGWPTILLGKRSSLKLPSRSILFPLGLLVSFGICNRTIFAQNPPSPPFTECSSQRIGLDASCRILIWIDPSGSLRVLTDPNASPTYDGSDDTLVGVLNQSSNSVAAIPLHGPNAIFSFDGDGICSSSIQPHPAACPFGPTGYEGPGVSFASISSDQTSGIVNFSPAIPSGGTAYFGLELAIQTQCSSITPPARLLQGDPLWASLHLGPSPVTIGDYGCFLTDLAMEVNYYAARQGSSFRTNPALLNTYLTANGGIDASASIPDSKIPLVSAYARAHGITLYYGGKIDHRDDFTLDQYLCNGYPPMLLVGMPHWVVATGQATSVNGNATYSDLDPDSWPNGDTLDNINWNNTYKYIQLFSDIIGPLEGLYFTGHSPIELFLTAPNGTQTGFNPTTGVRAGSIASSSYTSDQLANDTTHGPPYTAEIKQLSVLGSTNGKYTLQITGTGTGPYSIDVTSYDVYGNVGIKTFNGYISSGVAASATVQYSTYGNPSGTSITVPCAADINRDGVVNSGDLAVIQGAFGSHAGAANYNPAADVNHDGRVDIVDLAFVSHSVGCTTQIL